MEVQSGEYAGHVGEDLFIMFLQAPERELLVERLRRISEKVHANAKALQIQGIHARYGIYYLDKKESVEEAYSKAQIARKYVKSSKDQWFAFYDETIYFPYEIEMWQYTEKGKVDGIEGEVDLNIRFK